MRTYRSWLAFLFGMGALCTPIIKAYSQPKERKVNTGIDPVAEKHLSHVLEHTAPYHRKILGIEFIINDPSVYPPGKLTQMFAEYLVQHHITNNKIVADIGAACFALGIIAVKHGAKEAVGTDIEPSAIRCAEENILYHAVASKAHMVQGNGVDALYPDYQEKIDVLLAGLPWDGLTETDFNAIASERKSITRAFYDINDAFIKSLFSKGSSLLSPQGRMFITSSAHTINRVKQWCDIYHLHPIIVKEADLHNDGNMHYIVELKYY